MLLPASDRLLMCNVRGVCLEEEPQAMYAGDPHVIELTDDNFSEKVVWLPMLMDLIVRCIVELTVAAGLLY
jgi:hypothetical protein